jgi:purine-nucleoside phosphorylase
MSLYENFISLAYNQEGSSIRLFWDSYAPKEQKIYEAILSSKLTNISGSISELAKKYEMNETLFVGFIDGINGALKNEIAVKELNEDSHISLDIDFEALYKKMVEYKADSLYNLQQWDNIFTKEERKKFYEDQKTSKTYRKDTKINRNDPCPCGSGKKYKKCCGF